MANTAVDAREVVQSTDKAGHKQEALEQAPSAPVRAPGGAPQFAQMVLSGFAGAVTVTVLNETARRVLPHAPRMEVIGERALSKAMRAVNLAPPEGRALYRWTLAGDLLSNTLYYSMVGSGSSPRRWRRGTALGLAAGLGAVVLPRPLGLGRQPGARAPRTPVLTASWYLAGGLAAAAAYQVLR